MFVCFFERDNIMELEQQPISNDSSMQPKHEIYNNPNLAACIRVHKNPKQA